MAALLKPGVVLRDKWRLDKFLGRGGMSAVYAATHRNGMRGAIKVLHRELNDNEVVKKRFMREGYVANKLEHPGAVRVLDDDETDDGLVFLVMELLEGVTLKQRWIEADRRLELPFVIDVADQVLDVLEAAHHHKIVHRDLKPDNIFIVEGGAVKVLDFGIARVMEAALPGAADATSSAAMMGTPAFMPPEQALAHWQRVDGRSDLFAIAATAYTVLCGKLIHGGSTIPELLISAATKQVPPLRAALPELDEEVAAVFDRALRFEIGERWPDARAMRLALLQAKTRAQGNRTVKMSAKTAMMPIARSPAPSPPPPAAPPPAPLGALDTVVPTTTPMDSSSDPTLVTEVATVRDPEPLATSRGPAGTLPTPPVAAAARAAPRTLQSEVGPVAAALEVTPVRLQQPLRVEHVARLSPSRVPPERSSNVARLAIAAAAIAIIIAAAVVVRFVIPPRATSTRPSASPVSQAPPTTVDPTQRGAVPTLEPTASQTAAPSTTAAPSSSAEPSATARPTMRAPTNATPPRNPPVCTQWSKFDPLKCEKY